MLKKLLLIAYPPLGQVEEQVLMPSDADGKYGEYTGKNPDTTLVDRSVRSVDEVFEVLQIAPERIDGVPSELGRVTIVGLIREGEQATVDIDPFSTLETSGIISVGTY